MKQENLKLGLLGALLSLVLVGCTTPNDRSDTASTENQTVADDSAATPRSGANDNPDIDVTENNSSDILDGVATVFYFDFDKSVLKAEARDALLIHAESLRNNPRSIRLEGHADERGTREYNLALAERRANTVRDFLLLQGVNGNNIEVISYGEEKPVAFGSGEDSYSLNRRVELK